MEEALYGAKFQLISSRKVQVRIIDPRQRRYLSSMELRSGITNSYFTLVFRVSYPFRCVDNVKLGVYKADNMTIGWRIQMFRNGRGDVLNEKILTTLHSHLTLFHPCIDAIVNTINWIFSFDPHSILYNQRYTNVSSRGFIRYFHPFLASNFLFFFFR